ncbi:phage tail protein [Emticicia sp. CRIBPO]|uniref:phage tail protein n=1 Tax=Emticicia sp. CRIBPO TaxID=2683258 RepID=UPI00141263A7|nr:tail fiber protein [Emticicia sp. CRIBPO]NBA88065.1 phage tail protein [Emticicia sp. CRIBPO]
MEPFIGEIRPMAIKFAPIGYLLCDGSELPVSRFQALFAVIGNSYGGNGQTTFKLPNLAGKVVVNQGQLIGGDNYTFAKEGGLSDVTLTTNEVPTHGHSSQGASIEAVNKLLKVPTPSNTYLSNAVAKPTSDSSSGVLGRAYSNTGANKALGANTLSLSGGSQAHTNMMPSLVINYCIAYEGIFPQKS